ncbi:MAG: hypothetical protein HYZ49_17035 [Chloroflexi bacterium]|nr:hypothetical protein [Chloroflexota bacterium]
MSGIKLHKPNQNRILANTVATIFVASTMLLLGVSIRFWLVENTTLSVTNSIARAESALQPTPVITSQASGPTISPDTGYTFAGPGYLFNPTIQTRLQIKSQIQRINGVEFTASDFYQEAGRVFANVCYQLPGKGVWDINAVTLKYANGETSNLWVHETSIELASANGQPGRRCVTLEFDEIPPQADLSTLSLSIGSIGLIPPLEGHECEEYNARLQNAPSLNKLGIKAQCKQQDGGAQVAIISKPASMSIDDANVTIAKAVSGWIDGPWTFTGSLNK